MGMNITVSSRLMYILVLSKAVFVIGNGTVE